MTFGDTDINYNSKTMLHQRAGNLVSQVLQRAHQQNRLVWGMYSAAKQLDRNPGGVAFCILPQNHLNDVERHLNHMLMEAFCNENDIYKLKVDCEEKLAHILHPNNTTDDFSCILIEQCWSNDEEVCWQEEKLARLLEEMGSEVVIELPPD